MPTESAQTAAEAAAPAPAEITKPLGFKAWALTPAPAPEAERFLAALSVACLASMAWAPFAVAARYSAIEGQAGVALSSALISWPIMALGAAFFLAPALGILTEGLSRLKMLTPAALVVGCAAMAALAMAWVAEWDASPAVALGRFVLPGAAFGAFSAAVFAVVASFRRVEKPQTKASPLVAAPVAA